MNIMDAVNHVLGDKVAKAIILNEGLTWAVVAAMARATESNDPEAISTIRQWKDERVKAAQLERAPVQS